MERCQLLNLLHQIAFTGWRGSRCSPLGRRIHLSLLLLLFVGLCLSGLLRTPHLGVTELCLRPPWQCQRRQPWSLPRGLAHRVAFVDRA